LARLGALAGGAFLGTAAGARAAEAVKLGGVASDDMTPIVYGLKSGIFARAGLDVQLSKMPNGASVAAGVLSGSFDFGKATLSTILEAHERGIPFRCVTPSIVYDAKVPYAAFIMAKDATLATGKDFNNQLIAVSGLGDIGSLGLRAWVEQSRRPRPVSRPSMPRSRAGRCGRCRPWMRSPRRFCSPVGSRPPIILRSTRTLCARSAAPGRSRRRTRTRTTPRPR
jgi:hypothetical protein